MRAYIGRLEQMSDVDNKKVKVECVHCGKMISKNNIAAHRKKFHAENDKPLYTDLEDTIRVQQGQLAAKDLTITKKDQEIQIQKEELARVRDDNARLTALVVSGKCGTTNNNTTNNNDHSTNITVNNVNHYYVLDANGVREGLDLTKLRTFGTENVDYIDKTKPLPTILKDIYCNEAHPENRVLSHEFLNLQWIMFRYQDHILRLHLEMDRSEFVVFRKLVCDNVERLLGQRYENYDETYHAARELLQTMDNDVRALMKKVGNKKALAQLPIWNPEQLKGVEERIWKSYMRDPNYSQNVQRGGGLN